MRIKDIAKVELSQEAFTTFSGVSGKEGRADKRLHSARRQRA